MLKRTADGHTLLEMTCVLVLLGVLAAVAAPPIMALRDRIAVRSAGSLLVSGLSRARTVAVTQGGARAVLDIRSGVLRYQGVSGTVQAEWIDIATPLGVKMSAGVNVDTVVLRFDGRGIGQLANASIEFRRGGARGGVIVSGYGRSRQW